MWPLVGEVDVRAVLPTILVPTLVVHHADDPIVAPAKGRYVAENISGAKYVELRGRNMDLFVEPWRDPFQEIAEFLTGHQADMADDRVLATVLFTDIGGIAVHGWALWRDRMMCWCPARCATS